MQDVWVDFGPVGLGLICARCGGSFCSGFKVGLGFRARVCEQGAGLVVAQHHQN